MFPNAVYNNIDELLKRVAALEAAFLRPAEADPLEARVKKLEGELMAMKARLGKRGD